MKTRTVLIATVTWHTVAVLTENGTDEEAKDAGDSLFMADILERGEAGEPEIDSTREVEVEK